MMNFNPVSAMLDRMALNWIKMYYWPFFVAGNIDSWKELVKPMCFRK